ncbi:MAG TPA: HAD hydrolase-like protein [archaeon]|nr:HAD hydrolase-like protein [archaeon]
MGLERNFASRYEACMDAGNHVIKTYGGTPLPRRRYSEVFDFPTVDFYCGQGCDRETLEAGVQETFHNFYENRAARCHTREGARHVLQYLKGQSTRSIILSNHIQEAILTQLERLDLTDYFDEVLANTERGATVVGNNKMQRMANYLEANRIQPASAVIVGDSTEDIRIGKTLGMRTIALNGSYFSTRRLREQNPDHLISTLNDVIVLFR